MYERHAMDAKASALVSGDGDGNGGVIAVASSSLPAPEVIPYSRAADDDNGSDGSVNGENGGGGGVTVTHSVVTTTGGNNVKPYTVVDFHENNGNGSGNGNVGDVSVTAAARSKSGGGSPNAPLWGSSDSPTPKTPKSATRPLSARESLSIIRHTYFWVLVFAFTVGVGSGIFILG
jgi:hypothetical protein